MCTDQRTTLWSQISPFIFTWVLESAFRLLGLGSTCLAEQSCCPPEVGSLEWIDYNWWFISDRLQFIRNNQRFGTKHYSSHLRHFHSIPFCIFPHFQSFLACVHQIPCWKRACRFCLVQRGGSKHLLTTWMLSTRSTWCRKRILPVVLDLSIHMMTRVHYAPLKQIIKVLKVKILFVFSHVLLE